MKTLPDKVKEKNFFIPNEMGFEKQIKKRMNYWKRIKLILEKKK